MEPKGNSESTVPVAVGQEGAFSVRGVAPQGSGGTCGCGGGAGNGGAALTPVYAIGRIQTRFPTLGVEKEIAQVIGRADTVGQTDRQALHAIVSKSENRYLARKLCWVMAIEGLETYLLAPRDPGDLELLIASLRGGPRPTDVDVVVGMLGPIAPPDMCNGLQLPIVAFDHIYSFDVDTLIKAIPRPQNTAVENFAATAEEIFYRIMQMADNAGATDEHRALNYLAVRYPAVYATAADAHARDAALASVDVRPSRLSGMRRVVDVVFSYVNRKSDVAEKYFVRVDVTEEFPFLVSKIASYYER